MRIVPPQVASALLICIGVSLAGRISAQNVALSVTSSDNGRGLYSYTFTNSGGGFFWGVSPSSPGIYLQSYGVIQTYQPPGWMATVSPGGLVNWQITNGDFYFNEGVTLSVFSSNAVPRVYNDASGTTFFSTGTLLGEIYTNNTPTAVLGGGMAPFAYIGPNTNSAPTLAVTQSANGITIGWPLAAGGYNPQMSGNPADTNSWVTITNTPTVMNHSNFLTLPFSTGPQFFRVVNTNGG